MMAIKMPHLNESRNRIVDARTCMYLFTHAGGDPQRDLCVGFCTFLRGSRGTVTSGVMYQYLLILKGFKGLTGLIIEF